MPGDGPSFLVITEDGAREAYEVLANLTRSSLKWISVGLRTQLLRFQPLSGREAAIAAIANGWKDTTVNGDGRRRSLIRSLATHLLEAKGVVLFHVDADRPWNRVQESENLTKFEVLVIKPVASLLANTLCTSTESPAVKGLLRRLVLMSPCYSIESWLYQATDEGRRLCRLHHRGGHLKFFEAIEANRADMDERDMPKRRCCLRSKYNLELSKEFPTYNTYMVGKSYARFVNGLSQLEILKWLREISW